MTEIDAQKNETDGTKDGTEDKSEAAVNSAPNDAEMDIIHQVEYYFGDMNLPRDKFLQEQIKLDEGWVPLETMVKFHRLAKLSTDIKVIATALSKSTSGILEMSKDEKKIRRNPELPLPELNEKRREELLTRTAYAKGFPLDSTIDSLLAYFKDFPKVENVIMRKYQERDTKTWKFKGSVFVTFSTKEEAENFIGTKGLKYNDQELIIKWQTAYIKQKQEEFEARKKDKAKKNDNKVEKEETPLTLPPKAVLHFTIESEKAKREDFKSELAKLDGEVAFVDFNIGDKEGWVRFKNENEGQKVFDKLTEGKLKIGEAEATFRIPNDEEETEFLKKSIDSMSRKRKHNFGSNKRGGKRQFNGKKRRMDY